MRALALFLVLIFTTSTFADCNEIYKSDIETKIHKISKTKKIGNISTGITFGTMTTFWGSMGVIMVGPAGVLIGLQFGVFVAAPVAGTFMYIKKVHKERLENLGGALEVIEASQNNTDSSALNWLFKKLKKSDSGLTMEELRSQINYLNTSNALCDGSIKSRTLGLRQIKSFLAKPL